jgi:HAD superfamily hydrolase (TIGR01459 family)
MTDVAGLAELADRYDTFVFDQWGVLHDGNRLYEGVLPSLAELAELGKEIIILTNSSKSAIRNIERLDRRFGLPPTLYLGLISSADIIHDWLAGSFVLAGVRHPNTVLVLADEGDEQLLAGLDVAVVTDVAEADVIIVLSMPVTDKVEDHRDWMARAKRDRIAVVSPSCDTHTVRPDGVHLGMNAILGAFIEVGGIVHNVGKPNDHVYLRCRELITSADPARILMIGDQIDSDVVGARSQGWHALVVRTGAGDRSLNNSALRPEFVLDSVRW